MKQEKVGLSDVDVFYDSISKSYTASIQRCVPKYDEMLKSLFLYLKPDFLPKTILELGCGTGNLTQLIHAKFPNACITAVDLSAECINECKSRISSQNIKYIQANFNNLNFTNNSFDLVISSISIHHIKDVDKELLFQKLYGYQAPGGVLSFCDQFSGETDYIYQKHIEQWKAYVYSKNVCEQEWNMWMQHQQEHDFHSTLSNHMKWTKSAGYSVVDCTRKYLLWTTIYAEK
jgi:tRNA (cmo5U34)-methyltransferase